MTDAAPPRRRRIALMEGDGIGPELIESAVAVLDAVTAGCPGPAFEFRHERGGAAHFRRSGQALSPETLARLRSAYDALLKGPVGLPDVRAPDGTEAGLLGGVLRPGLDTYANIRPIKLLPGVPAPLRLSPGSVDYVIVRENTEGLYASRQGGARTAFAASDSLLVTRTGVERVAHRAFGLARGRSGAPRDGVRRVTCVDKSNVLRSFALFRAVFDEVAADYPDIEADHLYADAAAQALVVEPDRFDVVVTENFLGDILSDLGAGTVGGVGLCGSANVGDAHAYFEPLHGSAPTIAGQDRANPTSQILSAAMMLDHLGEHSGARAVRTAVESAYADGAITLDAYGRPSCGTRGVTARVVERVRG
ncbi:MAG: isocitrate/isopropylmalate dehydrogenase family protein [Streptomycetales bacterium]